MGAGKKEGMTLPVVVRPWEMCGRYVQLTRHKNSKRKMGRETEKESILLGPTKLHSRADHSELKIQGLLD